MIYTHNPDQGSRSVTPVSPSSFALLNSDTSAHKVPNPSLCNKKLCAPLTGLITLLQTTIGDRLPIIQGGSFAYLTPAFAIIAQIKASHTFASEHDRFVYTMRELQVGDCRVSGRRVQAGLSTSVSVGVTVQACQWTSG